MSRQRADRPSCCADCQFVLPPKAEKRGSQNTDSPLTCCVPCHRNSHCPIRLLHAACHLHLCTGASLGSFGTREAQQLLGLPKRSVPVSDLPCPSDRLPPRSAWRPGLLSMCVQQFVGFASEPMNVHLMRYAHECE